MTRRENAAHAGRPKAGSKAGCTQTGLSREEIEAALDELPGTPDSLLAARPIRLDGVDQADLERDTDF